ncbi:MAG: hypothetical protein EOP81_14425 [Variovorax sp.]|nr:MAG: hypothetical protein EOP81_14425 [Variovorax sp.]
MSSTFFFRFAPQLSPAAFLLAAICLVGASGATAQQSAAEFPAAAVGFLGKELPQMEAAVSARDRDFFEQSMGRMVEFSERWGFKSLSNPALTPYRACTEAVMDYNVVGLCRLIPAGDVCEPRLAPRFEDNLRQCRELAARR